MRKSRLFPFIAALCALATAPCTSAAAEPVVFSGLDVSASGRLLLAAAARAPARGEFSTLFLADARTRALTQLTFFPEDALLLAGGEVLQIQNRFGLFRTAKGLARLSPVGQFASLVGGAEVQAGSLAPMAASPDGTRLAFLRPRSAAWGELAVQEIATGQETVISDRIELSPRGLPAAWSPDSRFLVYARAGSIYYFSFSQLETGRVPAESLRRLGEGRIASVQWGAGRSLFYVAGRRVISIEPAQFFTSALYSGLLSLGTIEGELPFDFDPNFDSFTVSPDGGSMLLDRGNSNLLLIYLRAGSRDPSATAGAPASQPVELPHLALPRDTSVRTVLWSEANVATVLCTTRRSGIVGSSIYRLTRDSQGRFGSFEKMPEEGVTAIVLSPDQALAALVGPRDIALKKYATWQDAGRIAHPSPLHALWISPAELLVAGSFFIERVAVPGGQASLVALSQPNEHGWSSTEAAETVLVRTQDRTYSWDAGAGGWQEAAGFSVRGRSLSAEGLRVYLEPLAAGPYEAVPMIRDSKGFGTVPLVAADRGARDVFPPEEPVDFTNFAHGSRTRGRKVSLVFNAVDGEEGLTEVLNTLSGRGLCATFFVNGDFIRRNPEAVREIAASGHEVGSLFYAHFSLVDARLAVDAGFVKSGLARNEDDYHAVTGGELTLLWHAPYYAVTSAIIAAAAEMGYTYAGRDVDPLDWVARTEANAARGISFPAADLVEKLLAATKPGSIIPFQLGVVAGGREDYLFHTLDLVVSELDRRGYVVVPVSTLIEHAR